MTHEHDMRARLTDIQARMRAAASGREVTLVAVSKFQSLAKVQEAVGLGIRDFGENYAQELVEKAAQTQGVRWHFIGRFQKNKINQLKPHVVLWHTLASTSDVEALCKRVPDAQILLQVNIGREPQKGGLNPDDVVAVAEATPGFRGLMCIPPAGEPERWFAAMAALQARVQGQWLSMGMSEDFELAIRYGATHVRIGTALFGPRDEQR